MATTTTEHHLLHLCRVSIVEPGDEKAWKLPPAKAPIVSLPPSLSRAKRSRADSTFFSASSSLSLFFQPTSPVPAVRRRRLRCLRPPQLDARRRRHRVGAEDADHQGTVFVGALRERGGGREREKLSPPRRDLKTLPPPSPPILRQTGQARRP